MKYAFYPGCVAKGACPELKLATENVCHTLGIDLVELQNAACTGAGVISERNPALADALNARTIAMAEKYELNLMNVCSTCQGNFSRTEMRLRAKPDLKDEVNDILSQEDLQFEGKAFVKNFLWILVEDYGLSNLKKKVKKPLKSINSAPFYGCYILRPSKDLGYQEYPNRSSYLEQVIQTCQGHVVDYDGKDKCCGFPILTMNKKNSFKMAAKHLKSAKSQGSNIMVTPCPLCHLNLDANQPDMVKYTGGKINLPVLHLPQFVGLALGLEPKSLGLEKNIIDTDQVLQII